MGCELFYSPLNGASRLKWLGKHEDKEASSTTVLGLSTGIGPDQLSVNYTKSVLKNLEVIAGIDISHGDREKWSSVYKLGYNIKSDNTVVKGLLDSTYKVVCFVEEPLNEAMIVQFSAKMDFPKNIYDFGLGVMTSM